MAKPVTYKNKTSYESALNALATCIYSLDPNKAKLKLVLMDRSWESGYLFEINGYAYISPADGGRVLCSSKDDYLFEKMVRWVDGKWEQIPPGGYNPFTGVWRS
ncbi:MAG: hypothetical protein Unbinned2514contig1000_4 [Prokaryotic dsDNA virus sp.]|mgnify:CR=1 FL=1|nr:MAG: hypothetical protein Unbinned2514contig1000_4 [Prokaryotic dsDNA virus sp.]|tara:strand:+ start:2176 stop:2487 length:312 start_codon:yes stop_codon:yes gene_type:complete